MDEPLSNLDAKLRVETRANIARLHQRLGTTTVYVTHDQVEAMTMGTRIAVMDKGELQQVGTPQELYDSPKKLFVAGFIGSPSMNFVNVARDGTEVKGDGVTLPIPTRYRAGMDGASATSLPASGRSTSSSARSRTRRRSGPRPTSWSSSATRSCSTSRCRAARATSSRS